QRDEFDVASGGGELPGGLVGQDAAERPAAEPERAVRLGLLEAFGVAGGAFGDGRGVLEPLQAVDGLVVAEQRGELPVAGGGAARGVRDEQGTAGAGRAERPDGLARGLFV